MIINNLIFFTLEFAKLRYAMHTHVLYDTVTHYTVIYTIHGHADNGSNT